jgi:hypothetical protein
VDQHTAAGAAAASGVRAPVLRDTGDCTWTSGGLRTHGRWVWLRAGARICTPPPGPRRRLSSLYEGPHRPTAFHAAIWWRGCAGRGEGLEKNNKQHDHHQRRRERRGLAARRVAARERGAARKEEEVKTFVRV